MSVKKPITAKTITEATKQVKILEHKIAKSKEEQKAKQPADGLCVPGWLRDKINADPERQKAYQARLELSNKVHALQEWYKLQEWLKQIKNGETSLALLEAELEATPYLTWCP